MSVKSSQLQNPERDLQIENRENVQDHEGDELTRLRARIKAARALQPDNPRELPQFSTLDCWSKGKDAALRAIEGDK